MTIKHKIAILRFWLAAVVLILLSSWQPAMWFGFAPLMTVLSCSCCDCECEHCLSGLAPCEYQVELFGISNTIPPPPSPCLDCANFNAVWIVPKHLVSCQWKYTTNVCSDTEIFVRWDKPSNYRIRVIVGAAFVSKTYTVAQDCLALVAENVTNFGSGDNRCRFPIGTFRAEVTSLPL